jgi:hypothetical protein
MTSAKTLVYQALLRAVSDRGRHGRNAVMLRFAQHDGYF